MTDERAASIGDNSGDVVGANDTELQAELRERNRMIFDRFVELMKAAEKLPPEIKSEPVAKAAADLSKMFKTAIRQCDTARSEEKEPHLQAGREVDAFFKNASEPVKKVSESIQSRLQVYLDEKADAERRRREAEAAELKRKAAAAAEEAERLSEKLLEATQAAEDARAKLDAAGRDKSAVVVAGNEARSRLERAKADQRDAKAAGDPAKLSDAIARRGVAEADLKACRERLTELNALEAKAAEARKAADVAARTASVAVKDSTAEAASATKQATRIEDKLSSATPADLASVRGDVGAHTSNSLQWTFAIDDFDDLPVAVLWPLISEEDKRDAVSRFVRAGGRTLTGVRIYQDTVNAVR